MSYKIQFPVFMRIIIPFLLVSVMFLFGCRRNNVEQLQKEIYGISQKWVPDKRVGISTLTVVKGSGKEMVLKGETLFPGAKDEVLKLLESKGVSVIDSVVMLPDTIHLEKNWGIISVSVANLRSKPGHAAELVSQAIMGTPVRILKENRGWILVQSPDMYISWTNQSSVYPMSRTEISNWRKTDRIMFTDSYGAVYEDSKQSRVMSDLVAGAILVKKSEAQNLFFVSFPDGREGYVSTKNWLNFNQWKDTVSLVRENLIVTGERFMGFPYMWGGTSSKAMDCSGFVKTVCFLNGLILERDASQQINHGMEVDLTSGWDSLQPGDLLYFGSKQPYRVIHTGIYTGDSEVINASSTVQIGSLDKNRPNFSNYLSSTLIGARRIIGLAPERGYLPIKLHNWY